MKTQEIVRIANQKGFVVPAFNIPYIPMMEPVINAIRDENSFALIQVARVEWTKFGAKSLKEISDEYQRLVDRNHTRLHLDHMPVIDEDDLWVDYMPYIKEAIDLGYESIMLDGSRLSLEENIQCVKEVCEVAHEAGIACEAELGAVFGHEKNCPSYEEIFKSGVGFTKLDEAKKFVGETKCDWLSVAVGSIHGALNQDKLKESKPQARLDIEHLKKLWDTTEIPLVLHGGSGIKKEYIMKAINNGIAKINVGTEIRVAYMQTLEKTGMNEAKQAVYKKTREIIHSFLETTNTAEYIK